MNYSIIIPIYKESKNIAKLIYEINKELKKKKITFELIFIDDDSGDNSKKIFNKNKKNNTFFYIRKRKPRDLSKSVVYGFNKSKFDNLIVMDGDLQHNPKDIRKLIKKYESSNCDVVIGSRKLINAKNVNLNPLRFFFSKILNITFNFVFQKKLIDPMSGFFLIKKKIYINVKEKLLLMGYKILIDIILSHKRKLKIKEIFINFRERNKGFSKMRLKILLKFYYN